MPAYLGAPRSLGLKVISYLPGNHGTERDSHQGAVLLFDTRHRRSLLAMIDASSITAIRTAAVSGVATRLLAREDAGDLAILGSGVQARAHLEAMRSGAAAAARARVQPRPEERAALRRHHEESARRSRSRRSPTASAAVARRRPHLHDDVIARAGAVRASGSPPARTSTRSARASRRARELDTAAVVRSRLFVDRRESALAEAGDFLIPKAEGAIGDDHIVGEIGDVLAGRVPGARLARRDHAVQVARHRGRGPGRGASHRMRERARGQGDRRRFRRAPRCARLTHPSLDAIRAARARIAGSAMRTPLVRLNVEDAPAEIYLKLENLQPIGSFKLRGAGNAMALLTRRAPGEGRLHRERGQHGAGRRLERAAARRAVHGRRARTTRRRRSSPRSSAWARRSSACPSTRGGT